MSVGIAADSGDLDAEHLGVLGQSLEAVRPRSSKTRPGPAERSRTVRLVSTSPAPAIAPIRAPTCTAIPLHSSPRFSHSPMCTPARIGMPWVASAGTRSRPQRAAFVGPSNNAKTPSPVCLARRPPYLASTVSTSRSWSSSCRRQWSSPRAASSSVEPTMSVNRTVLSTRSVRPASACWPTNSSTASGQQIRSGRLRSAHRAVVRAARRWVCLPRALPAPRRARCGPLAVPAPVWVCGRYPSTARTSISDTASHISRAIIGLAEARCSLPHMSRTPGTRRSARRTISANAPSPQLFSMSFVTRGNLFRGEPPWVIG